MYRGTGIKTAVLVLALVAGAGLLLLNRSQRLNGDVAFMKSMIPHHSIAINKARKSQIKDPRVRELADQIIASQVREIEEMKLLIASIEKNGVQGSSVLPARSAEVTPQVRAEAEAVLR